MTDQIETPDDVIRALADLRAQAERGIALLAKTETELVHLQLEMERAEAVAFLASKGNIPEREFYARMQSQTEREAYELKKVEVNRIKAKLKNVEAERYGVMHAGKMIEVQWKTAGVGER